MATKGREPLSWSKVRKREKVGNSPVGRDHMISHDEEIPWVTQHRKKWLPFLEGI